MNEKTLKNSQGHYVPVEIIAPIDLIRHDLVCDIVEKAKSLREVIAKFKGDTMSEIYAFIDQSAQQYGKSWGGQKGNISLTTYDGKFKLQIAVSEYLVFDERLQIAKQLIDDCIHRWTEHSDNKVKALVDHAFQTDREGRINTGRVLGLRQLDIDDDDWKKAMQAISDSVQVASTKTYLRLYERIGVSDQWKPISLDIAAVN